MKNKKIEILILTILVIFVSLFIGNNKVYAKYCGDMELDRFCRESWNTVKELDYLEKNKKVNIKELKFESNATLYDYHSIGTHDMCRWNKK